VRDALFLHPGPWFSEFACAVLAGVNPEESVDFSDSAGSLAITHGLYGSIPSFFSVVSRMCG